ncbi:hypothetical protein [Streptomyces sp. NPDC088794]|uniref:hypothetical protein n=1 Tax=Streptomyces sp. NPDC088794 TaxID=3365902 RepID=UPI00381D0EED
MGQPLAGRTEPAEAARAIAVGALPSPDRGPPLRAVRFNGPDTPWCHDDIIDVETGARDALDGVIVLGFDGWEAVDRVKSP